MGGADGSDSLGKGNRGSSTPVAGGGSEQVPGIIGGGDRGLPGLLKYGGAEITARRVGNAGAGRRVTCRNHPVGDSLLLGMGNGNRVRDRT